jgi:hypothetical protein
MAYYLPSGKEWKGPIHKMNGEVHTGERHSKNSKVVTTKKPAMRGGK